MAQRKGWIIKANIKQNAGVNNPSHQASSPSRNNFIHSEVDTGIPF